MKKTMIQLARFGYAVSGLLLLSTALLGIGRSDLTATILNGIQGLALLFVSFVFSRFEAQIDQRPPFIPGALLLSAAISIVASLFTLFRKGGSV
jgi:hypothetical protein